MNTIPLRRAWASALVLGLAACTPLTKQADAGAASHRIRVRHPGFDSDAPKTFTLSQINDRQGFPSAYTLTVESVICPDQICRIITVKMTWDALGRYQRFELPAGEALEKGVAPKGKGSAGWDAVPFTDADYQKLDGILKDESSLLGRQKLDAVARLNNKHAVDGITGATPASIRDAVVEGAALTCYNLWHWANGEVAAAAREQTHRQCGEAMLLRFLASDQPHYALFALEHLRVHNLISPAARQAVKRAMAAGGQERIDLGLAYLRAAAPGREAFYVDVADVLGEGSGDARAHLLSRLAAEAPLPGAFFDAASGGLPLWAGYYEVHLFLQLAERSGSTSPALLGQAAKLLDSSDFFIARRAYGYLNGQPERDTVMRSRLDAFRGKAEREGRSL
jgi:hypothetical protein